MAKTFGMTTPGVPRKENQASATIDMPEQKQEIGLVVPYAENAGMLGGKPPGYYLDPANFKPFPITDCVCTIDANGKLSTSTVSRQELEYIDGLTEPLTKTIADLKALLNPCTLISTTNGSVKFNNVDLDIYKHPNHSGDVSSVGDGVTAITDKAVTLQKMNDLPSLTLIGNNEITSHTPKALTVNEIKTMLNVADANHGIHVPSGGTSGKVLSGDLTWVEISGDVTSVNGFKGDVTLSYSHVGAAAQIHDHVDLIKVDGTRAFTGRVSGVNPVNESDLTTKSYVDAIAVGLDFKEACECATTSNVASFTPGPTVVDGYTLNTGDRVLVKNQTSQNQNGIYSVQSGGNWTRASDFIDPLVKSGAFTFIKYGTVNKSTGYLLITKDPIDIDVTSLDFSQFSAPLDLTAGTGINRSGNVISLATSGATAGTYKSVTVDQYGRVLSGTNPTTLSGYGITDAAPLSHVGSGGSSHPVATSSTNGFMSSSDKTKLDGMSAYTHPNEGGGTIDTALTGPTVVSRIMINNKGHVTATSTRNLTYSDIGAASISHTHSVATSSTSGYMSSTDKTKLDDINLSQYLPLSGGTMTGTLRSGLQNITGTSINWNSGNKAIKTLTSNTSLSFTNPTAVSSLQLLLTQGSTAYTVAWPSSILWSNGIVPDLSGVGKKYVVSLVWDGTNYLGVCSGPF